MDWVERFRGMKALVVGDVMIDAYMKGVVERMSPEAPVPVVNIQSRFERLGGAANVAVNLKALGAEPVVFSVIGKDGPADTLLQLMRQQGMDCQGILQSPRRKTTIKHRVFDGDRQLLRADEEDTFDLDEEERHDLSEMFDKRLQQEHFDILILQDYNKGVLSPALIQHILETSKAKGIPVAVDPKKNHFFCYEGVTLFKPNAKELRDGLGVKAETVSELREAASLLQQRIRCQYLMVTLSEKGVMILHDGFFHHIPAHPRNIVDVSGAGDTVLSVAALCLAACNDTSNTSPQSTAKNIASLSNIAGGIVCESAGVVPIDSQRFEVEIQRLHHD